MNRLNSRGIKLKILLVVIGCLASIASACTPEQMQQLQGILQNINTANGTITITTQDGKTVTVNIGGDSQVTAYGSNTTAFNLEPGSKVRIDEKGGVARNIEDEVTNIEGSITSIQGNQVTIRPERGTDVTVNTNNQTRIKLAGDQTGTLTDLQAGLKVQAIYDPQTKYAVSIYANAQRIVEIEGNITQINSNNVTIEANRRLQATVVIDNTTSIKLEQNKSGTLSDLKSGMEVHAKFNPKTYVATEIQVQQATKGGEPQGKGNVQQGGNQGGGQRGK